MLFDSPTPPLGKLVNNPNSVWGRHDPNCIRTNDVTDIAKTFRKSTNTGRDGALIPIKIHKINRASFGVFTECFDDVCDVTRFPHCRVHQWYGVLVCGHPPYSDDAHMP